MGVHNLVLNDEVDFTNCSTFIRAWILAEGSLCSDSRRSPEGPWVFASSVILSVRSGVGYENPALLPQTDNTKHCRTPAGWWRRFLKEQAGSSGFENNLFSSLLLPICSLSGGGIYPSLMHHFQITPHPRVCFWQTQPETQNQKSPYCLPSGSGLSNTDGGESLPRSLTKIVQRALFPRSKPPLKNCRIQGLNAICQNPPYPGR